MGRTPCCWTAGIKKGPWTPEEDQILRSFIENHGHGNWRALPKHAGLLRCGKSCRLRWTNYLRPDVKRGNFSKDEEDTIIKLHATLGNKWSAIAVQLPGRTDNEIKNMWHTRLKKRACLGMKQPQPHDNDMSCSSQEQSEEPSDSGSPPPPGFEVESLTAQVDDHPFFPQQYSHSGTYSELNTESIGAKVNLVDSLESFFELDTSFWLDQISDSILTDASEFASYGGDTPKVLDEVDPFTTVNCDQTGLWNGEDPNNMIFNDELDFWFDLFVHSEEFEQL